MSEVICDPDYEVCDTVDEITDAINDLDGTVDVPDVAGIPTDTGDLMRLSLNEPFEFVFYFVNAAMLTYGLLLYWYDVRSNYAAETDSSI